jgi:hypothetical protein
LLDKDQKIYDAWVIGSCDRPSGRREKQVKQVKTRGTPSAIVYRKFELAPSPSSEFELPFGGRLALLQPLGKNGRNIPVVRV